MKSMCLKRRNRIVRYDGRQHIAQRPVWYAFFYQHFALTGHLGKVSIGKGLRYDG
jgi:hypothetical protein